MDDRLQKAKQILLHPNFNKLTPEQIQQVFQSILASGVTKEDIKHILTGHVTPTPGKIERTIRIGQTRKGSSYPSYPGYETIPAWSRGKIPWKNLSPFFIGPVYYETPNGIDSAPIFENFWQSFKVWERVDKQSKKEWIWPKEVHFDSQTAMPNENWYKWHNALLHHNQPVRRPNGKAIPLFAWWYDSNTKSYYKLDTILARKVIYIPFLKHLYRQNTTYQKLLEKFKNGQNILLVEPDGPLLDVYPQGKEFNLEILNRWIEKMNFGEEGYPHKYSPYGHGYVLASCLLEDSK